ncbi:MAG TPA: hypothetical protein VGT05_03705 [Patescibacteria group bacterium]|nr:hypothetical protein [Patescibacteria group bacterium]
MREFGILSLSLKTALVGTGITQIEYFPGSVEQIVCEPEHILGQSQLSNGETQLTIDNYSWANIMTLQGQEHTIHDAGTYTEIFNSHTGQLEKYVAGESNFVVYSELNQGDTSERPQRPFIVRNIGD